MGKKDMIDIEKDVACDVAVGVAMVKGWWQHKYMYDEYRWKLRPRRSSTRDRHYLHLASSPSHGLTFTVGQWLESFAVLHPPLRCSPSLH